MNWTASTHYSKVLHNERLARAQSPGWELDFSPARNWLAARLVALGCRLALPRAVPACSLQSAG